MYSNKSLVFSYEDLNLEAYHKEFYWGLYDVLLLKKLSEEQGICCIICSIFSTFHYISLISKIYSLVNKKKIENLEEIISKIRKQYFTSDELEEAILKKTKLFVEFRSDNLKNKTIKDVKKCAQEDLILYIPLCLSGLTLDINREQLQNFEHSLRSHPVANLYKKYIDNYYIDKTDLENINIEENSLCTRFSVGLNGLLDRCCISYKPQNEEYDI